MFRFVAVLPAVIVLFPPIAHSQADRPVQQGIPATVQAAEKEGAAFPHEAASAELLAAFAANAVGVEGTAERKCVEIPRISPAWRRSGEIIVGGQIGALKASKQGKVPWHPLHNPVSHNATLLVRSVRLDDPAITSRFSSVDYAFPIELQPGQPVKDGIVDREHGFYPSGFSLPNAGRWLLTVTSASDWGCFIVTVS
jgi:hypothetical protein